MTDITEVIGVCEWVAKRTTDFSAKVYKDGDRVYAVDSDGKTIAEGEAEVDDASVIQSAVNIGGRVFIGKGEYRIANKIAPPSNTKIEIIGEATKNIPSSFREKHIDVPWSEMARTRDKLIHGYFGVDLDLTFDIIEKDLPKLKKQILKILKGLKK